MATRCAELSATSSASTSPPASTRSRGQPHLLPGRHSGRQARRATPSARSMTAASASTRRCGRAARPTAPPGSTIRRRLGARHDELPCRRLTSRSACGVAQALETWQEAPPVAGPLLVGGPRRTCPTITEKVPGPGVVDETSGRAFLTRALASPCGPCRPPRGCRSRASRPFELLVLRRRSCCCGLHFSGCAAGDVRALLVKVTVWPTVCCAAPAEQLAAESNSRNCTVPACGEVTLVADGRRRSGMPLRGRDGRRDLPDDHLLRLVAPATFP